MIVEEIKNINSSKTELKKFGVTMSIILLVISLIMFMYSNDLYRVFAAAALLFFVSGYFLPVILKPVHKIWITISIILGWFSTRVILSLLYYLVITPIRVIARIFGKEFLELRPDIQRKSYWNYREKKQITPEVYERQF